ELGISQARQQQLLLSKILEKDQEGKVRLNIGDYRVRQQLRSIFELQIKQIEYLFGIQSDSAKLEKTKVVLERIVESINKTQGSWAYVITLGWWKMLQASGLPALLDEVLNEGFSPESWTIKSMGSCPRLALVLAQEWADIRQFDEAVQFFERLKIHYTESLSLPPITSLEETNKVEKILRWREVIKECEESTVKTLAFFWFVFLVLEFADLLPCSAEYVNHLYENVWGKAELLLKKSQAKILHEIENFTSSLIDREITWVPG
ncbi:unnamed protein product, partial [marine sediment metagenome]